MKNYPHFFNMVFDCLSEPVLLTDENKKPVYANQAFLRAIGELVKRKIKIENLGILLLDLTGMNSATNMTQECRVKDCEEIIRLRAFPLLDEYALFKIITNFASQDVKLNLHSQRIETLGMLAGGVAHDFNNILTGLLGHVTYLKNILPETGAHTLSVKAIEEGTKRASSLTKEILNFSRMEISEKPKPVELCDLIEKTHNLLRGAISPQFEVSYMVPDDKIFILADEAKIAQVIVNLAINARDALTRGGFIKVELSAVSDEKELKKVLSEKDISVQSYACIRVIDNGHGMSKEVLKHVFEPYFSTKEEKGTGLGLSIVNEIVNMFSGTIHILTKQSTAKEQGGTSMAVYFPILEAQSTESLPSDKGKQAELSRGTGTILVVDDEQPVRNVLSLSLEHLGYTVTCASSGSEALEIYKNSNKTYDLVILDMLMPNMTGDQTFFLLKELDPKVKVLLISGYSSQEAVSSVLDNGGLGIIQKPFTISDLATRVRQCL
jgi:two-component system cell cycle sensor histidine kinase/response regulator CckA